MPADRAAPDSASTAPPAPHVEATGRTFDEFEFNLEQEVARLRAASGR